MSKESKYMILLNYSGDDPIYYQLRDDGVEHNIVHVSAKPIYKYIFTVDELKKYKENRLIPTRLFFNRRYASIGDWYIVKV